MDRDLTFLAAAIYAKVGPEDPLPTTPIHCLDFDERMLTYFPLHFLYSYQINS